MARVSNPNSFSLVYHELGREVRSAGVFTLDIDDLLEMLTVSWLGLPDPLEDEDDSNDRCFVIVVESLTAISLLSDERSRASQVPIPEVEIGR